RIHDITNRFIPASAQLDPLDGSLQASDGDAILMAQQMARQLGLAVGISSGANFLGAIQVQQQLGAHAIVVTVLSDSNKKYPTTDLVNDEPVLSHYLTPKIKLLDYIPVKR